MQQIFTGSKLGIVRTLLSIFSEAAIFDYKIKSNQDELQKSRFMYCCYLESKRDGRDKVGQASERRKKEEVRTSAQHHLGVGHELP